MKWGLWSTKSDMAAGENRASTSVLANDDSVPVMILSTNYTLGSLREVEQGDIGESGNENDTGCT
jgi:hypothetical protein